MTALLGTIIRIGEINEARRVEIHFKALCRLPSRTPVPEWLNDQVLKVEREVVDVRELGHAGDALVLSVEESARWLAPLQVTPAICYGRLPETLTLALRWWKEEKGPEYTLLANGQRLTGAFVKDGTGFTAAVPLTGIFPAEAALPVAIEVSCDNLTASCTVLPAHTPYARKLRLPEGEMVRIENAWYHLDVLISKEGGGIATWREQGRGLNHFARPEGLIQRTLDTAGHLDYYSQGWQRADNMAMAALSCAGIRREEGLTRVFLEGTVDEGKQLHTTVTCQVLDTPPLAIWQREFHLQSGKKADGEKKKDEAPKMPIDEVAPMGVGFRSAWLAERHGVSGSRILCAYDEQLVTLRSAAVNDHLFCNGWRMSAGWAMAEHPERRAYMLYLFDRQHPLVQSRLYRVGTAVGLPAPSGRAARRGVRVSAERAPHCLAAPRFRAGARALVPLLLHRAPAGTGPATCLRRDAAPLRLYRRAGSANPPMAR